MNINEWVGDLQLVVQSVNLRVEFIDRVRQVRFVGGDLRFERLHSNTPQHRRSQSAV